MKKPSESSISNLMLGGVAFLFAVTIGILGGLFYSLRPHKNAVAVQANAPIEVDTEAAKAAEIKTLVAIENRLETLQTETPRIVASTPAVRAAVKAEIAEQKVEPQPTALVAAPVPEPVQVQPEPVASPSKAAVVETPAPLAEKSTASLADVLGAKTAPVKTTTVAKDMGEEMVPELKGPSYTAKKAAANGGDAYAGTKPGDRPAAKKPEPKIVVPPVVPAIKVDASKPSVYVLKDGRRIKAVSVKEDDKTVTVKNETGATISFKKTDIKEIVRG